MGQGCVVVACVNIASAFGLEAGNLYWRFCVVRCKKFWVMGPHLP